ncbi:Creatinase [Apostichopus japonicus]|uniref:Creatinase n=1 Tax=Stichopus japonicus TaxID=307972 RepID=A0A2G8JUU2_STIJA|nr:Creatinase [Apostichopus japonicus]
MRMVKSKEEIDIIKEGAKICEVGGAAVLEACEEGVREYEVAQHATNVLVREVAKRFPNIELQDTWAWFQTGINTDGAHNPPTSRQLQRGDIISMNVFPMICGYYTALERTLFMGDVTSDRHLQLWEINCEVHRKGLELVKPGVRCCDVVKELDAIYDVYGVRKYRTIGYGHSIGILSHYYGREADLEFRSDIETVLEPGMVVSMEPMLVIPEGTAGAGGYREHDMLVLTEEGNENLTEFPYGPEHNIIKK